MSSTLRVAAAAVNDAVREVDAAWRRYGAADGSEADAADTAWANVRLANARLRVSLNRLASLLEQVELASEDDRQDGSGDAERRLTLEAIAVCGLSDAIERGHVQLRRWTEDGTLLLAELFAERWGTTPGALAAAEENDEVFAVRVDGQRYYLAELLEIGRADGSAICRALAGLDAASKMIFLLRRHGGLGGKTVVEAVAAGALRRVLEHAEDWAEGG